MKHKALSATILTLVDKREDDAKKIVEEETELPRAQRCAGANTGEAGRSGGFRDLFEDMWGDFEDPQDSKKNEAR